MTLSTYRIHVENSSLLRSVADALFKHARSAFESNPDSFLGLALADFGLLFEREMRGIQRTDTDWLRALFVLRTWLERRPD